MKFALLLFGPMTQEACASKMNMIWRYDPLCRSRSTATAREAGGASCGYALYPAGKRGCAAGALYRRPRMYESKQANHARQDGAAR